MRKHIKACWGAEVLAMADTIGSAANARDGIKTYQQTQDIKVVFGNVGKKTVTFSMCERTFLKTRTEIVHWVLESMRPFNIIKDRGFNCLMKMGHPEYRLPLPTTVGRNICKVYEHMAGHVAQMLKDYNSDLNFTTDTWTLPNGKAMVAFTVHFKYKGAPMSLVLDVLEVTVSHSGLNLTDVFAKMLELKDLGLNAKVLSDQA
ncbi:hypothetical protein EVJ58_g269 [Rhodofomes roseus]|uniref:Uncharacterized protein n=1 Tax=Rhodofomes roseus TaxID=34475 RepID=A0A4Y9Z4T3_9APHY|nr:hypothetical protein EVJ58_g269 [Rhodofomes roseus]